MAIDIRTQSLFPVRRDKQIASSSGTFSYNISGGGGSSDASVDLSGYATIVYVDGSLSTITSRINTSDSSLNTLLNRHNITEASLGTLTTKVNIHEASIGWLNLNKVSKAGDIMTGDLSINANLFVQSTARVAGTVKSDTIESSLAYVSGFAGSGYKISNTGGEINLELDNLTVRNKLSAYEMEIREINAVNGGLMISVANGTPYYVSGTRFYFDEDGGNNPITFAVNDYIRAQQFTGDGIGSYLGQVTNVVHSATLGSAYIDATTISGTPWSNMKLVQSGNSSDTARQSLIYLTASDTNNPYIDFCSSVNAGSLSGKQKIRLGNLTGITDGAFGGTLSGFGLYADNVYLKGQLIITGGSGYANLTDKPSSLSGINSTEGTKLSGIEAGATVGATSAQVTAINTAQLMGQAANYGKMLYRDPTFISGYNSIGVYNNNGNGTVTHTRTSQTDSPNYGTSAYDLTITYTAGGGGASPGYGGFYFGTSSRANAVLITRIVAKIPSGRTINFASNGYGTGGTQQWLTSQSGTDRFEEYICYVKCGYSGSFSSTNFFYIAGGADSTFTWYVSFATVYDLTDTDISYINAAATTANWSGISSIPATLGTPAGSGLFLSSTNMGYYSSGAWKTYIDNAGNLILGDIAGGNTGLSWNQSAGTLSIKGSVTITAGSVPNSLVTGLGSLATKSSVDLNSGEVTNKSLANLDSTANSKLSGIAAGATVGATWGTNLYNIPTPLTSPSSSGLYITSSYLGYYNGSSWPSYIDSAGNCKFVGAVELGTAVVDYGGLNFNIALKGADLYENNFANHGGCVYINRIGYTGGTTYYRDTVIGNGKNNMMFLNCKGYDNAMDFGNSSTTITSKGPHYFTGSTVSTTSVTTVALSQTHTIVTGTSDITAPTSESDMTSMSTSITPKGNKILVMFSAPIAVTTAGWRTGTFYINVGGSNVRTHKIQQYDGVNSVSFQHIQSVTPGTSYTVKIRWLATSTAMAQRGSTDSERILTVVDLL